MSFVTTDDGGYGYHIPEVDEEEGGGGGGGGEEQRDGDTQERHGAAELEAPPPQRIPMSIRTTRAVAADSPSHAAELLGGQGRPEYAAGVEQREDPASSLAALHAAGLTSPCSARLLPLQQFCGRWKRVGARGLNRLANCDAPWLSEFLSIEVLAPDNNTSNPFSCPCLTVERYASLEAEQGGAEVNFYPLDVQYDGDDGTGGEGQRAGAAATSRPTTTAGASNSSSSSSSSSSSTVREVFMGRHWLTEVEIVARARESPLAADARSPSGGNRDVHAVVFYRSTPANRSTAAQPDVGDMTAVLAFNPVDGLLTERLRQVRVLQPTADSGARGAREPGHDVALAAKDGTGQISNSATDRYVFCDKLFQRVGSPMPAARTRPLRAAADFAVSGREPRNHSPRAQHHQRGSQSQLLQKLSPKQLGRLADADVDSSANPEAYHRQRFSRAVGADDPKGWSQEADVSADSKEHEEDEDGDESRVFETIGAAVGPDALETLSPLSMIEHDRYQRFRQLLGQQMHSRFGFRPTGYAPRSRAAQPLTTQGTAGAALSEGRISFDSLAALLSTSPCLHLGLQLADLLQDLTLRVGGVGWLSDDRVNSTSNGGLSSALPPRELSRDVVMAWIHSELCLRELYQICQRSPPGQISGDGSTYNPPVRKQLLTAAVEQDLHLCAQISQYSAASPFISLRDCAAHEFHSVGHFCAVVNRVSPTGHDFSDAKVNQHSGQSGPTRSGCPTMRDDDVVVGALAAGAVVARSPCRSAPGSSVHGQQRQSPAASSETPTSSKRTHAIRATAGSPVKEGGHGAERMPLPGDSSLGFAASTRSVDSPATNKAWSTPTTRTVVRWRKQPPSPAFMIWKLFYTHTCGTATPMQVTLSGFLKLLRTAGLLQGEEDFASNPVGDAPCISEDEAAHAFHSAIPTTVRGSRPGKASATFEEFVRALHAVAGVVYAGGLVSGPAAFEYFDRLLQQSLLTVRMANLYQVHAGPTVAMPEEVDIGADGGSADRSFSAASPNLMDKYRSGLVKVFLFATSAASSGFHAVGIEIYKIALRLNVPMTWPQFFRLCCILGLSQLASKRAVAEAFMAAHIDMDAAGLSKHFGYHEFEVALLTIAQGLRHKMLRSNVAPAESGGTSAATTSAQGEEWGAHDDTAAESDDTAAEDASLQLLFVLIWKRLVDIDKLTLLHTRKPVTYQRELTEASKELCSMIANDITAGHVFSLQHVSE